MVSELKGAFSKSTAVLLSVLLFVFGIISLPVPAKAAPGDITGVASTGSPRNFTYNASDASQRVPERINVLSLAGNSVAPSTPLATTGLDLDGFEPGSQLEPGSALTVGASGFVPNETGIKVVIYSTPTVLATDVKADVTGKAVWEGNLPADLVGEHTLTFQGSKSYGIVVNIAETVVSPVQQLDPSSFQCVISGAELKWGFKESWRSYLTTIAKGGWETSDGANYETPEFILTSTNGSIDSATGAAIIAFDGSINFYGHEGALNTTITNFFIEITAEGNAYFVADVIGELREGGQIKQEQVRIAKLNHPKLGEDGQAVIYEPVFTAEGGEAFSYAEGDALDPMTITVNYADCGIDNGEIPAATDGDSGLLWLWILLGTIAIVAVITIAVVARKNAKK
ncbi:MAG: HtaA domain-containing protein [Microbacteriaceae bacterium]|nr:HtaA domain-containing protein [Microbacteriaceae bacterium]